MGYQKIGYCLENLFGDYVVYHSFTEGIQSIGLSDVRRKTFSDITRHEMIHLNNSLQLHRDIIHSTLRDKFADRPARKLGFLHLQIYAPRKSFKLRDGQLRRDLRKVYNGANGHSGDEAEANLFGDVEVHFFDLKKALDEWEDKVRKGWRPSRAERKTMNQQLQEIVSNLNESLENTYAFIDFDRPLIQEAIKRFRNSVVSIYQAIDAIGDRALLLSNGARIYFYAQQIKANFDGREDASLDSKLVVRALLAQVANMNRLEFKANEFKEETKLLTERIQSVVKGTLP